MKKIKPVESKEEKSLSEQTIDLTLKEGDAIFAHLDNISRGGLGILQSVEVASIFAILQAANNRNMKAAKKE